MQTHKSFRKAEHSIKGNQRADETGVNTYASLPASEQLCLGEGEVDLKADGRK